MVFAWLALTIAVGAAPMAQTVTATTGAVTGLVTDGTRAVVPGVSVTLSGPSIAASRVTSTDGTGVYRFSAVPPGEYALTFAHAGFSTIVRDGVLVSLGFTAPVDAELSPGAVDDRIVVSGAPLIDLAATEVTTHFGSKALVALPGARDIFAVFASTPGLAMAKPDVGGGNALALHEYTAYGLRAVTGMNRNEVEGIRVGGANGPTDNYWSDFGSFAEIAVKAVANSAAMPAPGTLTQYVSKSGGNAYHGSVYGDVQDGAWQARNIDDAQIMRGASGGPGLDARDLNRLERFRDFNADVGGYLRRDRLWWYGAFRDSAVAQRYAWLLDETVTLGGRVGTGKLTYMPSPGQHVVGYLQQETFSQPSYFLTALNQAVQTSDALQGITFPVRVWKAEYNAALSSTLYVEGRAGGYRSHATLTSKSTAPRIVDTGANTIGGGSQNAERKIARPQVSGSISYSKARWGGSHTFRFGGEYMHDDVTSPFTGYGNACNCVSTLANGVPLQVLLVQGSNVSENALVTSSAYADDTWRLTRRLTLSLGLRLDRYQPALPEQHGPAGQAFAAIDPVLTFSNWGPRLGASVDLTGDGHTVLKAHYGRFFLYPGGNFAMAFNPNPQGWTQTYRWTNDANGNGQWDPGEQGSLISVAGGSAATRLNPDISNTHVDQATLYVERAVASDLAVRTGFVLNAKRATIGTINVNRPSSAYSSPVAIVDPGPDGRLGSADDGGALTAFNLSEAALALAPVNLTTNLPGSDADYYTWEITATKRDSGRLGLLASFTKTWSHESALGPGNDFTPNALINTHGGQDRSTTWHAKVYATASLPWDIRLVPVMRSQSGTPFARTFVRALNYGNATIKAEPVGQERTPTITLVDVRTEKAFTIRGLRAVGFFDLYNLFNTNAEQTVTTSSGASWLRPTSITGPRILRIGARLDW